ncbi:glycoside hydrolase [Lentinula aciculospora]|uniref:mannan endo-1,4-beta-mannosidase n=1 Tax=Lentinula aciculospora TaxID=153920 RepID=A0A9W9AVL2_9AGAR|nr:glycoside hydrolase [Lentinula aciculospora]
MRRLSRFLILLTISLVSAQSIPEYGQCGGIGYTGPTSCAAGNACVVLNSYFSQCLPGASTNSSASATSTTSSGSTTTTTTSTSPTSTVSGFVKTDGMHFTLNNEPFTVVGANAYWVGLMNYGITDMYTGFADIAATGATAVRTLGFNEVTTPDGVAYYQSWSGSTPTVNYGANGLENFDNVISAAKAHGLRLIVTLSDYGGMDVYVNQLLGQGSPHDYFYTNATVIAFVTRYLNEPGILAWELANEPRCLGSTSATSGTCTVSTISIWAAELSAFIKSIDPNHLVAIGDEGFFNDPGNPIYVYQGSLGVDFNANLNISTLDFGTFHESWGESDSPGSFGTQYIEDHATAMKVSNKPVIMEEFGVTISSQSDTYSTWYSSVLSAGLTGDLIWQAGSDLINSPTPNDGYAVYPGSDVYVLDTQHAAALKLRDGST